MALGFCEDECSGQNEYAPYWKQLFANLFVTRVSTNNLLIVLLQKDSAAREMVMAGCAKNRKVMQVLGEFLVFLFFY
jgi:hypothetical protein